MATHIVSVYPQIEQELLECLTNGTPAPHVLETRISNLEMRLGPVVYSHLLYLLCHLDFAPEEARSHWGAILEHCRAFSEKLDREVDFRVALLDYFTSVSHQLESPKIIEIKIFQRTQETAFRDELTGLYNYRYFRSQLEQEIRKTRRTREPLSLVLFDVDHFKWYNDHQGHVQGDRALRGIGRILRKEARATDVAARCGGEEFALLLPGTTKPQAIMVADRVRERIASETFPHGDQQPLGQLSVSGGVASFRADATDPMTLIDVADKALYLAKGNGRNRVMAASSENRDFERVDADFHGTLQILSRERKPFVTGNVSEEGFKFTSPVPMEAGEFFRFTLDLPPSGSPVEGVARVVKVESGKEGECEVGAKIMEISFTHAQTLRDCIERQADGSLA